MNSFIARATTDEQCVLNDNHSPFHTFRTICNAFIPYQTNESAINRATIVASKECSEQRSKRAGEFICFISNNISTLLPTVVASHSI